MKFRTLYKGNRTSCIVFTIHDQSDNRPAEHHPEPKRSAPLLFTLFPGFFQLIMLSLTLAYLFSHYFRGTFESPLQSSTGASSIYQQSNISVATRMQVQCDGTRFGHNPDLADCRMALTRIPVDRTKLTFMDRTKEPPEPHPVQNIEGLPFRIMGRKPTSNISLKS